MPLSPDYMTLTEYGALDDMTYEEVMSQFAPSEDDEVLVSRMRDGRPNLQNVLSVPLSSRRLIRQRQKAYQRLSCSVPAFPNSDTRCFSSNLNRFFMPLQPNWRAIKKSASLSRNQIRWNRLIIPGAKTASI